MNAPIVDEFFFKNDGVLRALRELTAADELVFYCGAGVSIDRTDVSWTQLVQKVFDSARGNRGGNQQQESKAIEYLLHTGIDSREAASIVVQSFANQGQSDNDFLASKLKDMLYERQSWNRGLMLRNLVQLSLAAASRKRPVRIITTNYDIYIEKEFKARRDELIKAGLGEDGLPGLARTTWADGAPMRRVVIPAGDNAAMIELEYLHGRVDEHGKSAGDIVLTEQSYAQTRTTSYETLRMAFEGKKKGVLLIGASLTDEPLIHALSMSAGSAGSRFALLSTPENFRQIDPGFQSQYPAVKLDGKTVGLALNLRGRGLGTSLLLPISFMQSAQFLEELRVSVTTADSAGSTTSYLNKTLKVSYPDRLLHWSTSWESQQTNDAAQDRYTALRAALEAVQLLLKGTDATGETMRIEAWLRRNPRTANRTLTLLANTTGPIIDESLMRHEPISVNTAIASVKTFLQGRPQLIFLDDLDFPASATRWKTFLCVPIFVQVPVVAGKVNDSSMIPVGVVTLTSTRGLKAEGGEPASFFAEKPKELSAIKGYLIGAGRELFGLSDPAA